MCFHMEGLYLIVNNNTILFCMSDNCQLEEFLINEPSTETKRERERVVVVLCFDRQYSVRFVKSYVFCVSHPRCNICA